MLPLAWIKPLLIIGLISLISSLGYMGYNNIKQVGYLEAETKYLAIIAKHNKEIDIKITELEKSSRALIAVTENNNTKLTQNIGQIVLGLNGKTLTVIKDGKCVPTKEFSDTFGKLNNVANQSMKESRK